MSTLRGFNEFFQQIIKTKDVWGLLKLAVDVRGWNSNELP